MCMGCSEHGLPPSWASLDHHPPEHDGLIRLLHSDGSAHAAAVQAGVIVNDSGEPVSLDGFIGWRKRLAE